MPGPGARGAGQGALGLLGVLGLLLGADACTAGRTGAVPHAAWRWQWLPASAAALACRDRPSIPAAQGDTTGARKECEKAMRLKCNGRPSVAPQLALAALHFNQRSYADALRL